MRIVPTVSVLALSVGLLVSPRSAHAHPAHGTRHINGASCVPSSDTVASRNYQTTARGVKFRGGTTGTIRLICAAPPSGTFNDFAIYYKDPDGTGGNAAVSVSFYYGSNSSPDVHEVGWAESNDNPATGYATEHGRFIGANHEVFPEEANRA
jgi:hypothetical protein